MNWGILDQAEAEFCDALARYESIESGLRVRFKREVKTAVAWITDQAGMPPTHPGGYRRVNLKIFHTIWPT